MDRVTKADLEQLVVIVGTRTGDDGYFVEYLSGRPRLYHEGDRGLMEVSPRLSTRELETWLNGFIEGVDAGISSGMEEEEVNVNLEVASPVSSRDFPWAVAVATVGGYRTWAAFPTEAEANRHADYLAEKLKWDVKVFDEGDEE